MKISNIGRASLKKSLRRNDERGASMVEYALIAALVALLGAAAVPSMAGQVSRQICNVGDSLAGASAGDPSCASSLPESGY